MENLCFFACQTLFWAPRRQTPRATILNRKSHGLLGEAGHRPPAQRHDGSWNKSEETRTLPGILEKLPQRKWWLSCVITKDGDFGGEDGCSCWGSWGYRRCFGEWSGEAGAERERARSLIHQANYASWVLRAHWRFCSRGVRAGPLPA